MRPPANELRRVLTTAPIGLVCGGVLAPLLPWELSVLAGWDVTALLMLGWIWLSIHRLDPTETARLATSEDDSRATTRLLLVAACVASLVGVLFALLKAGNTAGSMRAALTVTAILTITASWALVHTLYALRYAHLYYSGDPGGIDFKNDDERPDYTDFVYVAFTVGMTFQVSDTDIQASPIRRAVLRHALVAYLFGTVIVASAINVIAGLRG